MYDITTWEEIKYKVEERTQSLITMITREISTDRSLQELYPIHPVPWQLGEVLRQRAEAWLNRLYAICCEAQKERGKAIDYSFNLVVWAYCIEPFIMREVTANVYGHRASVFMELLLCAVGSSPETATTPQIGYRGCSSTGGDVIEFAVPATARRFRGQWVKWRFINESGSSGLSRTLVTDNGQ